MGNLLAGGQGYGKTEGVTDGFWGSGCSCISGQGMFFLKPQPAVILR